MIRHPLLPHCVLLLLFATAGQTQPAATAAHLPEHKLLQEKLAEPAWPLTWVITGDSITQGAKWVSQERSYPEIIQGRIRWEMNRRRDLSINSGISGERVAGLHANFEWRLLRFRPDIVSIMIGMNDAEAGPAGRAAFEAGLRAMVEQVRAVGAIPLLHRTNPIDTENPDSLRREDLPAYNGIISRVTHDTSTILIDHWAGTRSVIRTASTSPPPAAFMLPIPSRKIPPHGRPNT
jgi:acyl-CoA thioesterase-1